MNGAPFGAVEADNEQLRGLVEAALQEEPVDAPVPLALVGCGWIGGLQLQAYHAAGFEVIGLLDRHPERAEAYRSRYFPGASVYGSLDQLLERMPRGIIDVATHLEGRPETVERCLAAGFPVLSQKPFVDDLAVGERLQQLAETNGVALGVNQNGRWAPHFAAMLALVGDGLIGDVISADFSVAWPHEDVVKNSSTFSSMADLILFDFGAHWFDLIGVLAPAEPLWARAVVQQRPGQSIEAPLQASAIISGGSFLATLDFRAGEQYAELGQYRISGTRGVISHAGASLGGDSVQLHCDLGTATIAISDDWFTHGLAGAMRSMIDAVAAGSTPPNDAASSLRGLAIAFAALESARSGATVEAGSVSTRVTAL